jgi:hypothetical protein
MEGEGEGEPCQPAQSPWISAHTTQLQGDLRTPLTHNNTQEHPTTHKNTQQQYTTALGYIKLPMSRIFLNCGTLIVIMHRDVSHGRIIIGQVSKNFVRKNAFDVLVHIRFFIRLVPWLKCSRPAVANSSELVLTQSQTCPARTWKPEQITSRMASKCQH